MPNNCENCTHWQRRPVRPGSVIDGMIDAGVGECRSNPPAVSYTWPKTHANDYCSCHSAGAARLAQAQPLPPRPEYKAETRKGRKAEQLPLQ